MRTRVFKNEKKSKWAIPFAQEDENYIEIKGGNVLGMEIAYPKKSKWVGGVSQGGHHMVQFDKRSAIGFIKGLISIGHINKSDIEELMICATSKNFE